MLELFAELWLLPPQRDAGGYLRPSLLPLCEEAKAVFVDFYNQCGQTALEAGEHEEAAWGKLTGYGARLALVGQLLHDPHAEIVTGAVMRAACELACWSGKESVRIYDALAKPRSSVSRGN